MDEAIAAVEEELPIDDRTETWFAINGYRAALTYIMQASTDNYFEFSKQFLKSLHFMMTGFNLNSYPGQWRPGSVHVVNKASGEIVYTAPDVDFVDSLVIELVEYLGRETNQSSVVRAAMAHLNLTMIHPFKDGNGRMARALQTLVLAREGIVHPLFSSIEEWLGRNTDEYYRVLACVGQGEWNPRNDTLPWVRFCLKGHYQQAATLIRRNEEYESLFSLVDEIIKNHSLHDRMAIPLFDAALGTRLTNSRYQSEAEVTQYIASRDLKLLADEGLFEAHGEKRGRFYTAGPDLQAARQQVRKSKQVPDPYQLPSVLRKDEPTPHLPGF